MLNFEELKIYKQYLNTIQNILDEYFENQKEYLCCKEGCSHCCETGAYPYSKIEFDYLMLGFFKLDLKTQQEIINNIQNLKKEYETIENKEKFMYRCPFLTKQKKCSVYEHRGLICRTFGLLKPNKDEKINMPFCQSLGLNYSKVYNADKKMIDENLVKKFGYKNSPKAYNVTLKNLMDEKLFKDTTINFGEIKSLIDWI